MNARSQRSRLRTTVIVVGSAAAVVFGSLGVWARARTGPLWPTLLTDWSLGSALLTASSTAVGATVASRLPRNPVGWLFLAVGVLTGAVFGLRGYATLALAAMPPGAGAVVAAWGFAWAIPINMTCLALLLLLFPHGAPPSDRWRPVVALIVAVGGATTVATLLSPYFAGQTPFASLPNPTAVLPVGVGTAVVDWTSTFMLLVQALAVLGLVLRARHSHGAERQQVKWFVFAAVIVVFTFLPGFWFEPLFVVATLVAFPALPVAAGIGVLRYRLYDIDRIVSRTVAYAVLTVLLVGIYLAAVTALTALTSPVTGDSPIAVAAATLLAAAAFQPARRRIQHSVDRRFNRARYDAVQIADAYRARLRDELELKAIGDDLVETVRATMAPTQTSMWLRTVQGVVSVIARLPAVVALTFLTLTLALIGAMLLLQPPSQLDAAQTLGGSAVPLAFGFTGAVIASRRPRNGIGWLFCVFALGIPTEEVVTARLEAPGELGPAEVWVAWVSYWLWAPTLTALVTYLPLTFPHGRVVGRAARAILALAATGAAMVVIGNALDPDMFEGAQRNPAALHGHAALLEPLTMIGVLPVAIAVAGSATAVVRRFRRSTGVLRQQLKWFVFAMAVAIVAVIVNGVLYETGNTGAGQVAFASGFVWLPIALGVAIFRHHLYDIDRILSRTVSYGLLTAMLVALYLGAVTALTAVTSPLTGESSLAVAAATLVAAAAFQPLRRRIQTAVDRRFNRSRYDATRSAEAYRARLRDQLELESISADLVATARSTVQPTAVSLWLTPSAEARR